jgi:Spy/CpxP family protein refolding chaperone
LHEKQLVKQKLANNSVHYPQATIMKRFLESTWVCVMVAIVLVVTLTIGNAADAQPWMPPLMPPLHLAQTSPLSDQDLMAELEKEALPQLESIFTPEQLEQFKTDITGGMTFRKAFKALTLTPAQKTQLKTMLKSISKKDAFASLTPTQRKQLFLKKKEMFQPTSEEILDKINTGMTSKGVALPEDVKGKITAGLNQLKENTPN